MAEFELPTLIQSNRLTNTLRISNCHQQATYRCHHHRLKFHHCLSFLFILGIRNLLLKFHRQQDIRIIRCKDTTNF